MLLKRNCTRSASVHSAVVCIGMLVTTLSGWADPASVPDIPSSDSTSHPLTIAKEVSLANDYLFGRGVAQNSKLSAYWLEKAADAGDPEAQIELGYFYETGIGVVKSMERAAHWYQLAAHGGLIDAKASLGLLYFWGTGVPQDREMAAKLFREAAEKGNGLAAYQLGIMYADGAGVPPDVATAEHWYTIGAKHQNPQAEYQLGMLFFNAMGHKTDLHKAEHLLRSSAASGFVPATYTLGLLLLQNPALAKSPDEASQLLDEAASAGIWKASEVLGVLARDANGVARDDKAAYFHFRVAALQGGEEAQKKLEVDLNRLTALQEPALTQALDTEAREWYQKHSIVLEFVHKNDDRAKYPVTALAAPKNGEHELQLLPAAPRKPANDGGLQSAQVAVQ